MNRTALVMGIILVALLVAACGVKQVEKIYPPRWCDQTSDCVPCGQFCVGKHAESVDRCGEATHNSCFCVDNECKVDQCQSNTDCVACGTRCMQADTAQGLECGAPSFSCGCVKPASTSAVSICQALQCTTDQDCVSCAEGCQPASLLEISTCTPNPNGVCGCQNGFCRPTI